MAGFKSFVVVCLALCLASVSAFVAPTATIARVATKTAATTTMSAVSPLGKAMAGVAALGPAVVSLPAMADTTDIVSQLPTTLVGLEVQFAAYLAILLGVLIPVSFLILLFVQSETRISGEENGPSS